jgi:hypothetical protein
MKGANEILGVGENATLSEIKKAYHRLALQFHPDKNNEPGAQDKFREIHEAYTSLSACRKESPPAFGDIVIDAIRWMLAESPVLTEEIAERIRTMLAQYADYLTPMMMSYMLSKLKPVRVLSPSLDDLLDQNVFVAEDKFTVPMWHHELEFDHVIYRCVPQLPPNVQIDDWNQLAVDVRADISDVLKTGEISFMLGKKQFKINAAALTVSPKQCMKLKGCGVPKVNTSDILDTSTLEDIDVTVYLHT